MARTSAAKAICRAGQAEQTFAFAGKNDKKILWGA
jgi:hypothetical protein